MVWSIYALKYQMILSHLFHSFHLLQSQPLLLGDFACKFLLQFSLLQNPDGALVGELLPFTLLQVRVRVGNVDRQGTGPVIALRGESWVLIAWEGKEGVSRVHLVVSGWYE